jgi:hypothetical protein
VSGEGGAGEATGRIRGEVERVRVLVRPWGG